MNTSSMIICVQGFWTENRNWISRSLSPSIIIQWENQISQQRGVDLSEYGTESQFYFSLQVLHLWRSWNYIPKNSNGWHIQHSSGRNPIGKQCFGKALFSLFKCLVCLQRQYDWISLEWLVTTCLSSTICKSSNVNDADIGLLLDRDREKQSLHQLLVQMAKTFQ